MMIGISNIIPYPIHNILQMEMFVSAMVQNENLMYYKF